MRGLSEEFNRDISILESEFDLEREDMIKTHKTQVQTYIHRFIYNITVSFSRSFDSWNFFFFQEIIFKFSC